MAGKLTVDRILAGLLLVFADTAFAEPVEKSQLLYAAEGNRLRVIEIGDAIEPGSGRETVLIERASLDPERGRDVNGEICALPDGSGRFIAGEDTGQPEVPGGWGIFSPDGLQLGKLVATTFASEYPEPHGCAFGPAGRLFTTELGDPGLGEGNGQLIMWFPPPGGFAGPTPARYCKLAIGLDTPGGVVVDAEGRVYLATSSGLEILRFDPPFPSDVQSCTGRDATGAPIADDVARKVFADAHWLSGLLTYSGLAISPRNTLYAASVATGRIGEFDFDGNLIRLILDPDGWWPPFDTGTPQGLAVDASGNLYYADLDLQWTGWNLGPGDDGKLWRIEIDESGAPGAPHIMRRGLAFPDGLGVLTGDFDALPPSRENRSAAGPRGRE
jgi:hypothetical protein